MATAVGTVAYAIQGEYGLALRSAMGILGPVGKAFGAGIRAIKLGIKVARKRFSATKSLPRSGPIARSLGAASRSEQLAKKLKLNINSPTTRQVLNSLDDTVDTFISNFRKPGIRNKLPGEFLDQTVDEALRSGNTTVRKLLIDSRFVK